MKVIVAGLNKTGTTTIAEALRQLPDIKVVYHYMDHYGNAGKEWMDVCKHGGTFDDLRRKYEEVDVVTDVPAAYFWEELFEVFPESKVVLRQLV